MRKKRIKNAVWYPTAAAICIGVILFIVLWRFSDILSAANTFVGYFSTVIWGCVIAYIINPLTNLFDRLFKKIKNDRLRVSLANFAAFSLVILFLLFAVATLIPQFIKSIKTFSSNLDGYIRSSIALIESWGVSDTLFGEDNPIGTYEDILDSISKYFSDNIYNILTALTNIGKSLFKLMIAFILSMYLIAEKSKLKAGFKRLLMALSGKKHYPGARDFLRKCDMIFNRYIIYNLIDSLIVGVINALFMAVCGMQYIGLVSFVVAVTNLIPTFGPWIGAAIGGFVLFIINPVHALAFLVFTVVLQTCDAYLIKPKLFGNTLGVSGLWILVGVIVGGNMFGITGILLAIPGVAVIDLVYGTYIIPALERHSAKAEMSSDDEE